MHKKIYPFVLLLTLLFIISSCDFKSKSKDNPLEPTDNGLPKATLKGRIINEDGDPLENAIARVVDANNEKGVATDTAGYYNLQVAVDKSKNMMFIADKEGYRPDTSFVYVIVDRVVDMPLIILRPDNTKIVSNSKGASSIYVKSVTDDFVTVSQAGGKETSVITFEVQDSLGNPIDMDHQVTVKFKFGSNPGGGEFLYPDSVKSNALGLASVTLNSGTKSGVTQIYAEIKTSNRTIVSKPVVVSIHGGFPDINHFHVASEKLNYPLYGIVGAQIPFTAYVGDKYSNPVKEGTSVYFSTTSGIIEGSAKTSNLGTAGAILLTQPLPDHPTYGKGFFVVTAKTVDENSNQIETSTRRLLTGATVVSVSPQTFSLDNLGSQSFDLIVTDINGHPLSGGSTISITVAGEGKLGLYGDTFVNIPDTQTGWTNFRFTLKDEDPLEYNSVASITISVASENGNKNIKFSGTIR